MNIELKRIARKKEYTIGRMYIDGEYFCDTLEDRDRGLDQLDTIGDIMRKKVYGRTAIPVGSYKVAFNYSPHFKRNMPLLLGVPGFDGIRIHFGNTANDSLGCILLGENKEVGKVLNSRAACSRLYPIIERACKKGEVWIRIY